MMYARRHIAGHPPHRKATHKAPSLHQKIVQFFISLIAPPFLFLAIFLSIFFYLATSTWFDKKVTDAILEAQKITKAYLNEHKAVIRQNVDLFSQDITDALPHVIHNPVVLDKFLTLQVGLRSLSGAILLNREGNILGKSQVVLGLEPYQKKETAAWPRVPEEKDKTYETFIHINQEKTMFITTRVINPDVLLITSRRIDPDVLNNIHRTQKAFHAYSQLIKHRETMILCCVFFFILLMCLTLGMAIVWGLRLSRIILVPIHNLIHDARAICAGRLSLSKPSLPPQTPDELALLYQTFRNMAADLFHQQKELKKAYNELTKRHHMLKSILASISSGVLVLNHQKKVTLTNKKARKLLNMSHKKLQTTCFEDIFPGGGEIIESPDANCQQLSLRVSGQTLIVRVQATALDGGKTLVTFEDMTAFINSQKQATWIDVARYLTHEIRNPLTPIQLSAERIGKLLTHPPCDLSKMSHSINIIIRQVTHLSHLLKEFFVFAKPPVSHKEWVDVVPLIHQIMELKKAMAPTIVWELHGPTSLQLYCNPQQIQQVFLNILRNAVESIQEKSATCTMQGAIHIETKQGPDHITIYISDNGMGLDASFQDQMFEPYVTKKNKGMGLGLAIANKIIQEHQGTIRMTRHTSGGAQSILRFPQNKQVRSA
ncbi:HAMP domain-containing protein [bacterium NHP-B]|nr:HAMP domain-containing protein [bacterium NHP-B]